MSLSFDLVKNGKRPTDEFGFFLDSKDANPPLMRSPAQLQKTKELEREWLQLLDSWNSGFSFFRKQKIKRLCRLGIPESLRPQVWLRLSEAHLDRKEGKFQKLVDQIPNYTDQNTKDTIERDIHRCFPNHELFSDPLGIGQKSLREVLIAYAMYNPEVGYCQGMGMIVGVMLMRMPAEDSFWLLVATLDRYMKDYFSPTLLQLREDALVFNYLLKKHAKRVAKHLDVLNIEPLTYLPQWFMPLYTVTLPWRTVLRVWDMFYCDGVKALHRVGIGIMTCSKDHLIKQCNSTSDALTFLVHVPRNLVSPDELIAAALKFKITKLDIEKARETTSSRLKLLSAEASVAE